MTYRLAKSLEELRNQVNAAYPNRSKASDGWIGDAAHASRNSDHNPWIKLGGVGIVTGMDITHDPANGLHARELAEALINSRDRRIKYIISEGQICSRTISPWTWRKYSGSNGHYHHVHISVEEQEKYFDDRSPWALSSNVPRPIPKPDGVPVFNGVLIRENAKTNEPDTVKFIQRRVGVTADGVFGPNTTAAVKQFQKSKGVTADGIVGKVTWGLLLG